MEDDGDDDDDEAEGEKKEHGVQQLVAIGIMGSLDDMCVQASLLAGGVLQLWHMLVGVFLGCCIVVALCWGASSLQAVSSIVSSIPLWTIVAGLSAYTYASVAFGW